MPALIAVCPKCNNDAPVPEEAIGKKVKCKKCQNIFVIEPLPTGKLEKSGPKAGAKARPKTKSPNRPATNETKSDAKAATSASGGMRRPAKKSSAMLYILAGVGLVAALGAGGAAWYLNRSPADMSHAKASAKDRKDPAKDGKTKSDASRRDDAKRGEASNRLAKNSPQEPRVDAKAAPAFRAVEAPVAPLLKSTALTEVNDLSAVRQVFLFKGKTPRVGVRLQDKGKSFFDTYDLDKGLRVGHFPIPNDAPFVDVDPEGNVLACYDNDKHLYVYEVPTGSNLQDDWRPYHDIKDQGRFLSEGDYAQFAVLSKDRLLVLTSRNAGDIWDIRKPGPLFLIPGFSHEEFTNSSIAKGHDSAFSADRTLLAFATDEGIEFLDTTTGTKVGKTPKLSKFGPKVDVLGIGFDPEKKSIAAYISANKTYHLARFQVPSGEPIDTPDTVADPADFANIDFVGENLLLACEHPGDKNRSANRVGSLLDLNGRQLVECVFSPKRVGMFSSNVSGKQVAFAYLSKDKPAVGIVEISMPGTTPAGTSTPEMASGEKDKEKPPATPTTTPPPSGGLLDIFKKNPIPQPKTDPAAKDAPAMPAPPAPAVRQERWEFGVHGIAKKGETK